MIISLGRSHLRVELSHKKNYPLILKVVKSRRFRCKNFTRTSSVDPFDQNFNQTWYRASYIDDFQKSSLEPRIQPNLAQIVTLDFSCTYGLV